MKNVDQIFVKLQEILLKWDATTQETCESSVDELLDTLKRSGWTRKEMHDLLRKSCSPAGINLPDGAVDYISAIEDAITGYLHPACIMRFPDEDFANIDELTAYVRSEKWKQ